MSTDSLLSARKGVAGKFVSLVATAALALTITPSVAFAAAGAEGGLGWFDLPTEKISSFEHETTDAAGHTYTYSYLTSGISRVVGGFSQSMYYLMGINGVNFDRAIRPTNQNSGTVENGKLVTDAVNAAAGIMGTDVNAQPDEYLWNSLVHWGTAGTLDNAANDTSEVYIWTGNGNPGTYPTINVKIGDAEYAMPNVIYWEANFISSTDPDFSGNGSKSISEWVEIENQRDGRPHTAKYDPYVQSWETNSGGIAYGAELMYKLADAVDAVTEESRDANGNATVMSRYVDANGTDTSGTKFKTAKDLATAYEDFAKATQYYMIDKIESGDVTPKVAAVICGYQPAKDGNEAAYACRIFDYATTGLDNNSANFGGRLANSIMNFTTDINTVLTADDVAFTAADGQQNVVRWYPASKIAETADAIFVCDCPYANNRALYLAKNQDGDEPSIYSVDNATYDLSQNKNVNPLVEAVDAANHAELYYKYPDHLFGVWYAQGFENCWMAPIAAAYMYPDAFTKVENVLAYAEHTFYHITDANINGVMQAVCHDISMPAGATLGTPDSGYIDILEGIIDSGNKYYLKGGLAQLSVDEKNCGDLIPYDVNALAERYEVTWPTVTITDGGSYTYSPDTKTVIFIPDEGYEVEKVYVNGVIAEVSGNQLVVPDGAIVVASFGKPGVSVSGYVTGAASRAAGPAPEILGLSGVEESANDWNANITANQWSAPKYLLMGTAEYNSNPNPYFVNALAGTSPSVVTGDGSRHGGGGGPTGALAAYGSGTVDDNVWNMLPDVIVGINGTGGAVDYTSAAYGPAAGAANGVSDYSPTGVAYVLTSNATMIDSMYGIAAAGDAVAASTDKQLRYGNATDIAIDYEKYIRGTQGYILQQIAEGNVARKTVASISSYNESAQTYTIVTSGVAEGTSSTNRYMEACEVVCDNLANVLGKTTVTAEELAQCDALVIGGLQGRGGEGMTDANSIFATLPAALQDITYYVDSTNSSAGSMYGVVMNSVENAQNIGRILGFVYNEVVDQDDWMCYYYDNFYHLNSGKLADAIDNAMDGVRNFDATGSDKLEWTTADAATYDKEAVAAKLQSGCDYIAYLGEDAPAALALTDKIETGEYVPPAPKVSFDDVPADAYYADAVSWAVANGVTTGKSDTTFDPAGTCTRAQFVTFLWRANGQPEAAQAAGFADVADGDYFAEAVAWAVEQGITQPASPDRFNPQGKVTRAQVVTFLHRAAGEPAVSGTSPFADVAADAYYAEAVQWAVEQGITQPASPTAFNPGKDCNRAQVVTFLSRAYA